MKKKKILLVTALNIVVLSFFLNIKQVNAAEIDCGTYMYRATTGQFDSDCICANHEFAKIEVGIVGGVEKWCCGWYYNDNCHASPATPTPTPTPHIPEVNKDMLDQFNPLKQYSSKANQLSTPGGVITEILRFAFPIAGIILFVMLILAGLKMLTGATNSKSIDEGKQMITTAVIGFIILFAAYWIAQLLEIIFGIKILGN
jgi:hypothetical protein